MRGKLARPVWGWGPGAIPGPTPLFFQTERGGHTAATIYTLTLTCKRLCIDVYAYLHDVFTRLPSATPEELQLLLPDHWIAAHPEHRVSQRVAESMQAAEGKRRRRAERRRACARS